MLSQVCDRHSALCTSQFRAFAVYDKFVDGTKTLGENVADLGGLSLAWAAYKSLPATQQLLPPYSNDQLFWIYAGPPLQCILSDSLHHVCCCHLCRPSVVRRQHEGRCDGSAQEGCPLAGQVSHCRADVQP